MLCSKNTLIPNNQLNEALIWLQLNEAWIMVDYLQLVDEDWIWLQSNEAQIIFNFQPMVTISNLPEN